MTVQDLLMDDDDKEHNDDGGDKRHSDDAGKERKTYDDDQALRQPEQRSSSQ